MAVKDGQPTVSATEFAQLTGVPRERLRTWERRHNFPRPIRQGNGSRRRYASSDVSAVIAVRELSAQGTPLKDAIRQALATPDEPSENLAPEFLTTLPESIPLPIVLISGPIPLRVEYVNPAATALPGHPRVGDLLLESVPEFSGSPAHSAVIDIFAGSNASSEHEHPSLDQDRPETVRSLVFRIENTSPGKPLAAMIDVQSPREHSEQRALAELGEEYAKLELLAQRDSMVLASVTELAQRLRDEEQAAAIIRSATDAVTKQLDALDTGVALYMTGELLLGTSSQGLLGPAMVVVSGRQDLTRVMRVGKRVSLQRSTARAFGAPRDATLVASAITVAGESVAALIIAFEGKAAIDSLQQQFIDIASSIIGFALLRDRFTTITEDSDEDLEQL